MTVVNKYVVMDLAKHFCWWIAQIYEHDPVKTEKLTTYIAQRLQYAQNLYGAHQFQQDFLDETDPAVLKQLQDELLSNR